MKGSAAWDIDWGMRAIVLVMALALLSSVTLDAAAQPEKQRAAQLAERGLASFDRGDYAAAIEQFQKAEELFHAPTHLSFMAQAHEKLGHLLEARALYQRLADQSLPADAPDAFIRVRAEASKALAGLDERIPTLTLLVQGPEPEQVELSIDGRSQPGWRTGPIALEPGQHRVTAAANGFESSSKDITLGERQREQIELVLVRLATSDAGPGTPRETTPEPGPSEHDAPSSEPSLVPAGVAFAVGGAGLVVGAVTGALSFKKVGELEEVCPTKQCGPEHQHIADDATTLGNVSTAGFVVGGVGVAAGAALLAWALTADGEEDAVTLRPVVALGSLSLEGRF